MKPAASRLLPVFLALWAPSAGAAGPVQESLQRSAAAYRDGRLMDALKDAVAALEADPDSSQAKNFVFTIGEDIRKQKLSVRLRPGEKEKSVQAARAYLELRRQRTDEVLRELREASSKSGDLRSPSGFFAALEGMDRSLGPGFRAEGYGDKAQVYFSHILENLEGALKKRSFVEASDRLRAEGYLAYYKGDLEEAAALWEKALRAAPEDAQVRNDLESVREMARRKKEGREIEEYEARAEASFDAGLFADAVEAWREVLRRDPRRPGAVEGVAAARIALEKSQARKKVEAFMAEASGEYKAGRFSRAAEIWLDVLQVDPASQSARVWLKMVGKKLEEETRSVPELLRSEPVPSPASASAGPSSRAAVEAEDYYHKGLIAYSSGDIPKAVDLLTQSLARDPGLRRARQALEQCQTELSLTRN